MKLKINCVNHYVITFDIEEENVPLISKTLISNSKTILLGDVVIFKDKIISALFINESEEKNEQ